LGSGSSSRRRFLQASTGTIAAFWSALANAPAQADAAKAKAKSVILIFNCGGPSHIDLWDPKPNAGDAIRGPFQPIATKAPGIHISELLPRMAERMDKLAVLRTMHHSQAAHNAGMYWSTVGRPYPRDDTRITPAGTDYPSFGTLAGWLAQRDGYTGAVPPYVITPFPHCDSTVFLTPGQYGGCLGVRYDPFVVDANPNDDNFKVRNLRLEDTLTHERLQNRLDLLKTFDAPARVRIASPGCAYDVFHEQAASIVLSDAAAKAFDLSQEPAKVRERYGRDEWGQSHLLARRLVESGVKFVTTVNGRGIVWDTHNDNFNRMKNNLVPRMEQAYAALLDDLDERGLLDSTLVVWLGDFGRTPTINNQAGRDHWPQCYSAVLAGGGIRGGQVVGQSDKTGAYPASRPIMPADLHATVFSALGYDASRITYQTVDGRPTQLSEGEPIREVL